jgi:hypothetical protein
VWSADIKNVASDPDIDSDIDAFDDQGNRLVEAEAAEFEDRVRHSEGVVARYPGS